MQETFRQLYELSRSGPARPRRRCTPCSPTGMLMNVMAAINAAELDETWARVLSTKDSAGQPS